MYAAACAQPALLPCSTSTSISIVELNETERLISSSISFCRSWLVLKIWQRRFALNSVILQTFRTNYVSRCDVTTCHLVQLCRPVLPHLMAVNAPVDTRTVYIRSEHDKVSCYVPSVVTHVNAWQQYFILTFPLYSHSHSVLTFPLYSHSRFVLTFPLRTYVPTPYSHSHSILTFPCRAHIPTPY
jgi:hypothetical protein